MTKNVNTSWGGQGKSGSFKKSWKVGENGEGQGKSGNFITVARKKEYYSVQRLHFSLKI